MVIFSCIIIMTFKNYLSAFYFFSFLYKETFWFPLQWKQSRLLFHLPLPLHTLWTTYDIFNMLISRGKHFPLIIIVILQAATSLSLALPLSLLFLALLSTCDSVVKWLQLIIITAKALHKQFWWYAMSKIRRGLCWQAGGESGSTKAQTRLIYPERMSRGE